MATAVTAASATLATAASATSSTADTGRSIITIVVHINTFVVIILMPGENNFVVAILVCHGTTRPEIPVPLLPSHTLALALLIYTTVF